MSSRFDEPFKLTPELLLRAYAIGVFPMAERRGDESVFWVNPKRRGIIPLDSFHVPKRLARTVRQNVFEVRCDTAFAAVMEGCAESTLRRRETWINDMILEGFHDLHTLGYAHSVECWRDGCLTGGLYGVSLGGAFFGESMFARERDASKVALVHLVARLILSDFTLLDTQFVTEHLRTFGAREITAQEYQKRLDTAVKASCRFYRGEGSPGLTSTLDGLLRQSRTQTS